MEFENGETHPSYGQVQFVRQSGNTGRLYGSPLANHSETIGLVIRRSELNRDLGRDWYFGTNELIEVRLSPAQFADLLTQMNMGSGVPCTIERLQGTRIDGPPETTPVEHEHVEAQFKEKISRVVQSIDVRRARVEELLEKKSLTREDRNEIKSALRVIQMEIENNAPYMVAQFGEATEKLKNSARAEMAAVGAGIVDRLGFEKLQDLKDALGHRANLPPAIEAPQFDVEQPPIKTNHIGINPNGTIEVAFTPPTHTKDPT